MSSNDWFDSELFLKCGWCGCEIRKSSLHGNEKRGSKQQTISFCDIFCAKLYNDFVHHIVFDFMEYTNLYYKGLLDSRSASIYQRCKGLLFEQLPIYTFDQCKSREEVKKEYAKIFML